MSSRLRLGDRDQQPVLVLGVLAAERIAGGDPLLADPVDHLGHGRSRRTANSRATGASCKARPRPRRRAARARRRSGGPAARRARRCPRAPARPGRWCRRARSGPARCRCCGSPSRAGCAARGSAGRGRSRAGRRRRWSRRRSARASGAGAPRSRRRSERRTAEVEPIAQRLALAHGDVHPALPRRAQDPEGDRVDGGDAERPRLVGGGDRLQVLHGAEEVRVLDEDRGDVGVDVVLELARVR